MLLFLCCAEFLIFVSFYFGFHLLNAQDNFFFYIFPQFWVYFQHAELFIPINQSRPSTRQQYHFLEWGLILLFRGLMMAWLQRVKNCLFWPFNHFNLRMRQNDFTTFLNLSLFNVFLKMVSEGWVYFHYFDLMMKYYWIIIIIPKYKSY